MAKAFKKWFRNLSKQQAGTFYLLVLVWVLLTIWHNPTDGYRRMEMTAHTPSIQEAIQKWEEQSFEKGADPGTAFRIRELEAIQNRKGPVPEKGYFYMIKTPWWWPYGYRSKGFDPDSIPVSLRSALLPLNTLGGYLHTMVIVTVFAFAFIWLFGIRTPSRTEG